MKASNNQSLNNGTLPNQKPARPGFFQWWYNLTSIPEPPADASFVKREEVRRSHLLSLLIFFMLMLFVVFLPAALAPPLRPGTFSDASDIPSMLDCNST